MARELFQALCSNGWAQARVCIDETKPRKLVFVCLATLFDAPRLF
jgi:hypothetical protein